MSSERRKIERIDRQLPVVFTRDELQKDHHIEFRGPAETVNMSLDGLFSRCTYMLKEGTQLNVSIDLLTGEFFSAEAEVVYCSAPDVGDQIPGIGVRFTRVDQTNRERLLRFFVSDRVSNYYHNNLLEEFPHLDKKLTMQDVALIVNKWEEFKNTNN